MEKWCRNCIHWDFSFDNGDKKFGKCNNESVSDDLRLDQDGGYDEDVIFTAECFGCVWFEDHEKAVTKITARL